MLEYCNKISANPNYMSDDEDGIYENDQDNITESDNLSLN